MKKTLTAVFAFSITILVFNSCTKDKTPKPDCTTLATQVSLAGLTYNANPTIQNCSALKTAYITYINSSCIPAEQRSGAQKQLSLLKEICP
ncbi:hypothetical protein I5907_19085 [Panacibacter sp. DH6]|uniref:Uncharacterized protein n=1 Tax=Panacibacter microcysteis TaxID=2793269 RepID=A0A931MCX2_9BACT|nr:hypothetical protein [Panacibacter microcysteis]MBG9378351.1 hypothetical protein [Panacibacter microcysteis]